MILEEIKLSSHDQQCPAATVLRVRMFEVLFQLAQGSLHVVGFTPDFDHTMIDDSSFARWKRWQTHDDKVGVLILILSTLPRHNGITRRWGEVVTEDPECHCLDGICIFGFLGKNDKLFEDFDREIEGHVGE